MRLWWPLVLAVALLQTMHPSFCDASPLASLPEFHGHVKTQGFLALYDLPQFVLPESQDSLLRGSLDARLTSAASLSSSLDIEIHPSFLFLASEPTQARTTGLGFTVPLNSLNDDRRLFDLSAELQNTEHLLTYLRLDRLAIQWSGNNATLSVGRQALSWGNGVFYQTLDFANPFAPQEIDTDFKVGDDMAIANFVVNAATELEMIALPRRSLSDNELRWNESTAAARLHHHLEALRIDLDAITANHYGDLIFGLGVSAQMWGAVLRSDVGYIHLEETSSSWSALVNVDRSWVVFDTNIYGSFEYFHNGFGVSSEDYLNPPTALNARLQRGELFTLGRHYLASSLQIELTPLTNLFLPLFWNLEDSSAVLQPRLTMSLSQEVDLLAGILIPLGSRGTEYGGLEVPPFPGGAHEETRYVSPGYQALVKLSLYY